MSDIRFDGRVAVITGAGGGLGKTYALELARRGASVVVNDLGGSSDGRGGSSSMADATVKEIIEAGGKAAANYDSVATPEGGKAIIQTALDNFGRVDILVNNAGITMDRTLKNMTPDQWEKVIAVDLSSVFYCSKAVIGQMLERGYGRIIGISSVVGQKGNIGQTNYAAAKAAIIGFTKALALETAKKGITVNAVAPGFVKTAMTGQIPKEILDKIVETIPVGRMAEPSEVARAVLFLADEKSSYITGQVVNINGGLYM